jgi:hypothetical protein
MTSINVDHADAPVPHPTWIPAVQVGSANPLGMFCANAIKFHKLIIPTTTKVNTFNDNFFIIFIL